MSYRWLCSPDSRPMCSTADASDGPASPPARLLALVQIFAASFRGAGEQLYRRIKNIKHNGDVRIGIRKSACRECSPPLAFILEGGAIRNYERRLISPTRRCTLLGDSQDRSKLGDRGSDSKYSLLLDVSSKANLKSSFNWKAT